MADRLLIVSSDAQQYRELLCDAGLQLSVAADAERIHGAASRCNIVLGDPDLVAKVLDRLDNLEWVQSTWAGVAPLIGAACRHDYRLTGVKGVFGPAMAEYVFCYLLMHERDTVRRHRDRRWNPTRPGRLRGRHIGFMGVGSIGEHVASTAKHFEMHTRGYTRSSRRCAAIDRYYSQHDLLEFVAGLDYLVALLPDTPETTDLLNSQVFAHMQSSAVLINAGRANVINDADLIQALNTGAIAGAVLDVVREEPLAREHPFWQTPNMLVTSHTAAITIPSDIVSIFKDNLERYRRGTPLNYQIDFQRGY